MEVREIKTTQVDEKCPRCGNGWMRPTGIIQNTTPPLIEHSCNSCGNVSNYTVRYPYTVT